MIRTTKPKVKASHVWVAWTHGSGYNLTLPMGTLTVHYPLSGYDKEGLTVVVFGRRVTPTKPIVDWNEAMVFAIVIAYRRLMGSARQLENLSNELDDKQLQTLLKIEKLRK